MTRTCDPAPIPVELRSPRNVTGLGTPESSAAPRREPESDRTHETTRCHRENCTDPPAIPHRGDWWCATHAPREAMAALHVPRVGETPRATAGMISPKGVVGYQPDGTKAEGNASWEWRPPIYAEPDSDENGRDLDPVVINRQVRYQPAPPIHVHNDHPGSAKDIRRRLRAITETEAERLLFRQEARKLQPAVLELPPARLARERMRRRRAG